MVSLVSLVVLALSALVGPLACADEAPGVSVPSDAEVQSIIDKLDTTYGARISTAAFFSLRSVLDNKEEAPCHKCEGFTFCHHLNAKSSPMCSHPDLIQWIDAVAKRSVDTLENYKNMEVSDTNQYMSDLDFAKAKELFCARGITVLGLKCNGVQVPLACYQECAQLLKELRNIPQRYQKDLTEDNCGGTHRGWELPGCKTVQSSYQRSACLRPTGLAYLNNSTQTDHKDAREL